MIDDNRHRDVASDQDRAQGVRLAGPTGRDTRLPRWQWQLLYVRVFCSTWPRAPVLSSPSFARLLAVLFGARTNRWCAKGDTLKQYTRGITDRNATVPVKVNWILKFDTLCQAVLGSRGQTSESLTSLFCLITEDWIIWNERSGRSTSDPETRFRFSTHVAWHVTEEIRLWPRFSALREGNVAVIVSIKATSVFVRKCSDATHVGSSVLHKNLISMDDRLFADVKQPWKFKLWISREINMLVQIYCDSCETRC